jgi:hypothetical protein
VIFLASSERTVIGSFARRMLRSARKTVSRNWRRQLPSTSCSPMAKRVPRSTPVPPTSIRRVLFSILPKRWSSNAVIWQSCQNSCRQPSGLYSRTPTAFIECYPRKQSPNKASMFPVLYLMNSSPSRPANCSIP